MNACIYAEKGSLSTFYTPHVSIYFCLMSLLVCCLWICLKCCVLSKSSSKSMCLKTSKKVLSLRALCPTFIFGALNGKIAIREGYYASK